jgi:hypothetical protein
LYAFLGWALWILWQELRQQSKLLLLPQIPPLTLLLEGQEERIPYRFCIPEVLIGRDPTCALVLEDRTISARHTRLAYHHGQWWIEDLHSRNGTLLNQQAVSDAVVITSGDQLQCGQVIFQVRLGDEV